MSVSQFARLHEFGTFLMPNAWDVGSARLLESAGCEAVATTSSGHAATLGRHDQNVTLDELVAHVSAIASSVHVPLSVDSEDGYASTVEELADTVDALAAAGAAGVSIEDYRPGAGILGVGEATDRVGAFVEAAHRHDLVVTARAENHLYGAGDLTDTIDRLRRYEAAGADVVYAPGLVTVADIAQVVSAVESPVNALLMAGGPTVAELREVGVRRVSTGGALAFVAYGAAMRAFDELRGAGTQSYAASALSWDQRASAFGD